MKRLKATTNDPKMEKIARSLVQWHEERVNKLKDLVAIDDDTEISVVCADGSKLNLSAAQRVGFKVGASAVLELFEAFPLRIKGA